MNKDLFQKATLAHTNNEFKLAEKLYIDALKVSKDKFKIYFMLGTLYIQKKNFNKALDNLLLANEIEKLNAHLLMNLGITYRELNDHNKSENFFLTSLEIEENPDCYNNYALLHIKRKEYEDAIKLLNLAFQKNKNPIYQINLSDCYFFQKKYQESLSILKKITPNDHLCFEIDLRLIKNFFYLKLFEECLKIPTPSFFIFLDNSSQKEDILGKIIDSSIALGEINKSEEYFLRMNKTFKTYDFYKATLLQALNKYDESEKIYLSLVKKNIFSKICLHNLGLINFRNLQTEKAIKYFKASLEIDPNYVDSKKQLGMCQLSLLQFDDGWNNFLSYLDEEKVYSKIYINLPKWNGASDNQNVIIIFDQGIGDQIFFSKLLLKLAKSNNYLCIVDKRLINLFSRSFNDNILFCDKLPNDYAQNYNFYCYMAELAKFYIHNEKDIEMSRNYLYGINFLKQNHSKKLIGLSWHSKNRFIGKKKSMSLDLLLNKLSQKYNTFVSLQYNDNKNELDDLSAKYNVNFIDSSNIDKYHDIEGLINLVISCDEIFTISNVTAHLAGALGIKVNLLLPNNHPSNTWYWFSSDNIKSLWYPNIRLLIANQNESFSSVLKNI